MMRKLAIAFLAVSSGAWGQPVPTLVPEKPSGSEAEIRLLFKEYEDAWRRHDTAEMARVWTEDADYTEPDGRTVFGQAEVKRLLSYEHASVFKESRLHLAVERVRFLAQNLAIVDGSYELFNAHDPSGKPIGTRTGYFTSILAQQGRAWKVAAARLYLPVQLIWREK